MGNPLTIAVGNVLTTLMGNVLTEQVGKVLDIYTFCSNCDSPVYDNIDKREGIDVICADCTSQLLEGKLVKVDENNRRGKSFSERIKAARRRLKWTQGQVAEYLGFKSKVSIMKYEKGLRYPKKKVLEKVLKWTREIEGLHRSEIQEWLKEARI